jgi:hypothetical protein
MAVYLPIHTLTVRVIHARGNFTPTTIILFVLFLYSTALGLRTEPYHYEPDSPDFRRMLYYYFVLVTHTYHPGVNHP